MDKLELLGQLRRVVDLLDHGTLARLKLEEIISGWEAQCHADETAALWDGSREGVDCEAD